MTRPPFALFALLACLAAPAPARADAETAERCLAATPGLGLGAPLPRVRAALREGVVRVVAIGSSSTRGVGASSWAATYPEVMKAEIERLVPRAAVELTNAGRNGETAYGQLARIETDAMALRPHLVIWQVGSNDVVMPWGGIGEDLEPKMVEAIRAMRAGGADVILMDLQNTPLVTMARQHREMIALTARAARASGAGLFRRFDLMENAVRAGVPLASLTSWDQLHNTDAAYACMGRAIARAIRAAAR